MRNLLVVLVLLVSVFILTSCFTAATVATAAVSFSLDSQGTGTKSGVKNNGATNEEGAVKCQDCYIPGSGLCKNCSGVGHTVSKIFQIKRNCEVCNGTGKCTVCGGSGFVVRNHAN